MHPIDVWRVIEERLKTAPDGNNGTYVHSGLLPIEQEFDTQHQINLMRNWNTAIILLGVVYIISAHAGRLYMKTRPAFHLRPLLIIWNLGLSAFSMIAVWRFVPDFAYVLWTFGPYGAFCRVPGNFHVVTLNYWCWMFSASKIVELGDTAFLVLRKRPLTFLHWIHHSVTMVANWFLVTQIFMAGRLYISMNLIVHCFMYLYYGLKAMGVPLPLVLSKTLTIMQTAQMFIGFFIACYCACLSWMDSSCVMSSECCVLCLVMYGAYVFLFLHFYARAYGNNRDKKELQNKQE